MLTAPTQSTFGTLVTGDYITGGERAGFINVCLSDMHSLLHCKHGDGPET